MKPWLHLTVVTLTVGGGFTGFSITLQQLLKPQSNEAIYFVIVFAFLFLYAFVTASGIACVQNPKRTAAVIISFAIQIPWISSSLITYKFTSGFHATVGVLGGGFTGGFSVGSSWFCALFQKSPFGLGVNVFALIILVLLIRSRCAVLHGSNGNAPQ